MADAVINTEAFWNADAYWQSGKLPWTIFAYPASLADGQRLPRDETARRYLAELQQRGIAVGIWSLPGDNQTLYFACPYEDRLGVECAVKELEQLPSFGPGFLNRCCEHLFSIAASHSS